MKLELNSRVKEVKIVQEKLIALGYSIGKADGIFGIKTKTAITELQKKIGLGVTGEVGPWLYNYLLNIPTTNEKSKKTVVITAGHSNTDPGAVNGKRTEAQIAVEIRNIVKDILLSLGYNVLTDGDERTNKSLNESVKLISKGDLAIEIHLNAAANKNAGGVEALAPVKYKQFCGTLCSKISKILCNKVRGQDGGWKSESSGQHTRLAYVSNGGIILETFFISNDAELLMYDQNKEAICKAIVEAIEEYFI